jgi:hypothetical protein
VRGRRGHVGALLLVAGVLALVRDVEHAQVGVGALHLLRGGALLRGTVRAPVVAPAMQQQQQYVSVPDRIGNFFDMKFVQNFSCDTIHQNRGRTL